MNHLTSRPKLVIFDCDGAVVDSEPLTNQVIRDDLAAHGLALPLSRVKDLFSGGTLAGVGIKTQAMGAKILADWAEALYAKMFATLARSVAVIPGIEAVLDCLDGHGILYAFGSNGTPSENRDRSRIGTIKRVLPRIQKYPHKACL